ncbi:MAG: aminoacyl-histidine dipeptidase [Oscillospiraceae bacterium]|nr:aminoacyl-histidine dipeptidase [Oscillospiraceae bacterium]
MAVLSGIEPKEVFRYFEEICGIPHGSGNTKPISDYCVRFADEHGLRYIQDDSNNVIIFKDGTPGYEQSAPVMIQGHLDMVCEKEPDCTIDFEKDGLSLRLDGGIISADGTTLGGDDGIAVAMGLALLASSDIPHPPLEVVLTVDEEIGMLGADALDCSPLKSRLMLNLDSEDEGILLVSCAGGVSATCHLPVSRKETSGTKITLKVGGLTGGHSGVEIDKGRANANQLMGRLLNELSKTVDYALISVSGGLKDNAIPRESSAEIVTADIAAVQAVADKFGSIFAAEFRGTDPELYIEAAGGENGQYMALDTSSKQRVIAALVNLPGGIQRMSNDIAGLVQTSLNMGILKTVDDEVIMSYAVRSSVGTEKEELVSRITNLMDILGGTVDLMGDYPAWEYKSDSVLRNVMTEVFEEQYGHKPEVAAIHAGLECGLFAGKLPGLDCVSCGPDMKDIHTPKECMDVASVQRTWKYVLGVLKRLK